MAAAASAQVDWKQRCASTAKLVQEFAKTRTEFLTDGDWKQRYHDMAKLAQMLANHHTSAMTDPELTAIKLKYCMTCKLSEELCICVGDAKPCSECRQSISSCDHISFATFCPYSKKPNKCRGFLQRHEARIAEIVKTTMEKQKAAVLTLTLNTHLDKHETLDLKSLVDLPVRDETGFVGVVTDATICDSKITITMNVDTIKLDSPLSVYTCAGLASSTVSGTVRPALVGLLKDDF